MAAISKLKPARLLQSDYKYIYSGNVITTTNISRESNSWYGRADKKRLVSYICIYIYIYIYMYVLFVSWLETGCSESCWDLVLGKASRPRRLKRVITRHEVCTYHAWSVISRLEIRDDKYHAHRAQRTCERRAKQASRLRWINSLHRSFSHRPRLFLIASLPSSAVILYQTIEFLTPH